MFKYLIILSFLVVACTPVDSVEETVDSEDRVVFESDSLKYFNYIIECDSLKLIENPDSTTTERIEILTKEIKYYRDKWGKYLN